MSAEYRIETRQRVFLKGRIVFNNGASSMDCLVRDMSATGARVSLSETTILPEVFDLYIAQKDRTYRCKLAWRREDGVGVTFAEEQARTAPGSPAAGDTGETDASTGVLLRRIGELEAENAALRRLLASMAAPGATAA
ncbi:PilZ domain-containing protein [Methylobacterium sp. sgz302541]|uniref:PilZ domain-containing protein n=1 Tax=unclassified Methylobacterium TaxID=2615210 RepID=UPI003D342AC3